MFTPEPMLKMTALVLQRHVDPLTRALGQSGFVHLIPATDESREHLLQKVSCQGERQELDARVQRCQDLMLRLELPEEPALPTPANALLPTTADDDQLLKSVDAACRTEEVAAGQRLTESGLLVRTAELLSANPYLRDVPVQDLRQLTHLHVQMGKLPRENAVPLAAKLGGRALLLQEPTPDDKSKINILLVAPRTQRFAVDSELAKAGFEAQTLPAEVEGTGEELLAGMGGRLAAVQRDIQLHKDRCRLLAMTHGDALRQLLTRTQERLAELGAQEQFGSMHGLVCVAGWIPAARQETVENLAQSVASGLAILEFTKPEAADLAQGGDAPNVPVLFKRSPLLEPFQDLVSIYGVPRYSEIEPSLFLAIGFVLMFGVMFGDIGHGAVLMLAGILFRLARPATRKVGTLLLFGGAASVLFGFVYGSLFGYEKFHWLEKIRMLSPMEQPGRLFILGISIGILTLSVGVLVNILNQFRRHRYLEGIFDKAGVIGLLFYWGIVAISIRAWLRNDVPGWEAALVIALPCLLIFAREPIMKKLGHVPSESEHSGTPDEGAFALCFQAFMEVFEMVTGFLGNTISFIRVGAFALSHTALCMTIFVVVDELAKLPGGTVWSVIGMIAGNLLVILLEGMIVAIQGLRLQYYEFFSRFFKGDGIRYAPFRLDNGGAAPVPPQPSSSPTRS